MTNIPHDDYIKKFYKKVRESTSSEEKIKEFLISTGIYTKTGRLKAVYKTDNKKTDNKKTDNKKTDNKKTEQNK